LILAGLVDARLGSHRLLSGLEFAPGDLPSTLQIVEERQSDRQTTLLVRGAHAIVDPRWKVDEPTVEDLILAYMRRATESVAQPPVGPSPSLEVAK
jgi:ABC-2 type transport system ATP-binding protein